ncbi:thermonuclease family protein [Rhizobium sp. HT1-10]|uniref:thermonuclease family protein n=1 Tax=Rhizobium sp. HT1-10 TaxID=3111638 RepID=UPI003C163ECB
MAARRGTRKTPRKTAKKRSSGGSGMLPWLAVATVLAIVGYDHWSSIKPELKSLTEGATASPLIAQVTRPTVPAPLAKPQLQSQARSAGNLPVPPAPVPVSMPIPLPTTAPTPALTAKSVSESFGLCGQGTHINCVFDGSTFWVRGTKIRIADIETPALGPSRCLEEGRRANAAKLRLLSLLNAGPFTLQAGSDGAEAGGGVQRRVLRGGESFGDTLVREGLAHRRMDRPASWCA